jgi:hypothetical protein
MRATGSAGFLLGLMAMVTASFGVACGSRESDGAGGGGGDTTSATSTEATATATATATAAASTTSATTGAGGSPNFEGTTRVDGGSANATEGSADVAIAPDGTIYVSWVAADDIFVAQSTDGGETFGAAVQVDDGATIPLVSMARHPYVTADNDRVAVSYSIESAAEVHVHTSDASNLAFSAATLVGTDVPTAAYDFPKAMFLPDGNIVVAFHGYPQSGARIFVSRESAGFASEAASAGAPGVPCECCPIDTLAAPSGDLLLAFRNNDNNTREMWSAVAPSGGGFATWAAISTTEGTVPNCPMQGPRLSFTSSGQLAAVWSRRSEQAAGAVVFATSDDGGATWSGGTAIVGFTGDEPTIALGASGTLYVTGVTGSGKSSVASSTDGGGTWSPPEALAVPDGDLGVPQAEGAAGIAALAGVSSAGSVWLRRME